MNNPDQARPPCSDCTNPISEVIFTRGSSPIFLDHLFQSVTFDGASHLPQREAMAKCRDSSLTPGPAEPRRRGALELGKSSNSPRRAAGAPTDHLSAGLGRVG